MQTSKKDSNTNNPDRIAKVAEIISLIEEAQKNKGMDFSTNQKKAFEITSKAFNE